MKLGGGDVVLKALKDAGVNYSFGIPGTHNIELYDVLGQDESFSPVLVTDEQSASFMADGFARAGNKLAVVNVVPGAGLTHAMSGIAEAYMDNVPMLVLVCGKRTDTGNAYQLHDIDQISVVSPVCKRVYEPQDAFELYKNIREACDLSKLAPSAPTAVIVPANYYLMREEYVGENFNYIKHEEKEPSLDENDDFEKICYNINESKNIALYIGSGSENVSEHLAMLAEKLDAIVFTSVSGKGVFPEDHPRFAWNMMGPAAPKSIQKLESKSDCLLAIGCRFGEVATASYGFKQHGNLIHVDVDKDVFNQNYTAKQTIQCTAERFVTGLVQTNKIASKPKNVAKLEKLKKIHDGIYAEQAEVYKSEDRVSPYSLISGFQERLNDDAVYVTDSGNGMFLAMELLRLKKSRSFLGPFDYSCMGYSVPAAIGAKFACPERDVVALVGDGAFLMTGLEMITAVNENLGVVFCILRDGELSQIAQFQKQSLNRVTLTKLHPINLESLADSVGITYIRAQNDKELEAALDQSVRLARENKPVLLEVAIDYSQSTYFSKGVVKTNFLRFPLKDRFRLVGRVLKRKLF